MEEKVCKNCGQTVDKKAVICPNCGVKIKKPLLKKWWFWIAVIFIIVIFAAASKNTDNTTGTSNNENTTSEQPVPEKNSPKISKEEFESLETGMTYEEVVSIIGGEGELSSQVGLAGYDTKIYMWEGSFGANANVTFQNNELVSKAQFGLR